MNRLGIYQYIINHLEDTYKRKNSDYGNSVGDTYEKFGDVSFLTRITDKYNRILSLVDKGETGQVKDEALEDTILDLANYCLLWLVERDYKEQKRIKEKIANTPTERKVELRTTRPVSNSNEVNTTVMEDVQSKLNKMDDDDKQTVLNVLDAYGIKYKFRPNGMEGNTVKMVLVVEDMAMLQRVINNLGL